MMGIVQAIASYCCINTQYEIVSGVSLEIVSVFVIMMNMATDTAQPWDYLCPWPGACQ